MARPRKPSRKQARRQRRLAQRHGQTLDAWRAMQERHAEGRTARRNSARKRRQGDR